MRPWNKRKDSKNSYQQRSWEFAVEAHARNARMLMLARKIGNQSMIERLLNSRAELEERYPMLKGTNRLKSILEKKAFLEFMRQYTIGAATTKMRLGQAFHQHFKLDKSNDMKQEYGRLCQLDGQQALDMIEELFEMT